MNPELVICTLDDGGVKLGMEFTVNLGKGYVASGGEPARGRAESGSSLVDA